jgi:hypothetical protein
MEASFPLSRNGVWHLPCHRHWIHFWICHFGFREGALRLPPLVGTVAAQTHLRTCLHSRRGVAATPRHHRIRPARTPGRAPTTVVRVPCLGAEIRAPLREGSMAACSDEPARWWVASSVVPPPHSFHQTAALTRSLLCDRWRCEMKWGLGFGGAQPTGSVLFALRARLAVDWQWMVSNVLGLIRPRWADEMLAQASTPVCDFHAGWDGPKLTFWASFELSNFKFLQTGISLFN